MSRGYLDPAAEVYSVYNSMNYRNLRVRLNYRQDLTDRTTFGGWNFKMPATTTNFVAADGASLPTASIHSTHRNRALRLTSSAAWLGDVLTGSTFDNAHVTHQIPRSDIQYAWISASLASGNLPDIAPLGFARHDGIATHGNTYDTKGNLVSSNFDSAIKFAGSSSHGTYFAVGTNRLIGAGGNTVDGAGPKGFLPTDFVGLNYHFYEPLTSSTNTLGWDANTPLVASTTNPAQYRNRYVVVSQIAGDGTNAFAFNGLILNRQGPYGWPSWKQIRGGQHPIARYQKNNNIISVITSSVATSSPGSVVPGKSNLTRDLVFFTEPPVERNMPIVITFTVDDPDAPNGASDVIVKCSHSNNLTTFTAKNLNKILDAENKTNHLYDSIKKWYLDNDVSTEASPIQGLKSLVYKEVIFPRKEFANLEKSRVRTQYDCKFWRNNRADRSRLPLAANLPTADFELSSGSLRIPRLRDSIIDARFVNFMSNSMGFSIPSQSMWPLDNRWSFGLPGDPAPRANIKNAAITSSTGHLLS
jgi:hypothetical protein